MKKCKKILSLVLALVMLLSAVSAGLISGAVNKKFLYSGKDAAQFLTDSMMNQADEYELSKETYATIMLDFADQFLGEANLPSMTIAIPVLGSTIIINIQLDSINSIVTTLDGLYKKLDQVGFALGDLGDLDLSGFTSSTKRNTAQNSDTDVNFITQLVNFLKKDKNKNAIYKVINKGIGTDPGQLNPGNLVNGYIPDNVKEITNDIVGFLKKTLFEDSNASFDKNVGTLVSDLINGLEMEQLEGYTFSTTDSIYSTIDKLARVLTRWLVKNLQNDTWGLKDKIYNAIPTFETDYPFINLDGITEISWDWEGMPAFKAGDTSTYLVYRLNNLIGHVIDKVIPVFNDSSTPYYTGGWTLDNSANSLNTLNSNIEKAAQFADILLNNGGTFTAAEAAALSNPTKSYAMVLANAIINIFFPSLKVEKSHIQNGDICVLAVQALNEFLTYYIPEKAITKANGYAKDLYSYTSEGTQVDSYYDEARCKTLYKPILAEILAKFATGYLPSDKINFTNTSSLDAVLRDLAVYFLNYVCKAGGSNDGALGTVKSTDTAYTAVDRIIFSLNTSGTYVEGCTNSTRNNAGILPEGFLPDSIKTSSHTHCTSKDVVDHLFNCVENLNVGNLLKILIPNSTKTEMTTPLLPNLACYEVIRILNAVFPGIYNGKTASLDALLTNSNLANIVNNMLGSLDMNYHIYPALKLVAFMMGLSTPMKKGNAEVTLASKISSDSGTFYKDIDPIINTTSKTVPSGKYYIKVANTSKGINSGYHNASGSVMPWYPYNLYVQSITCENDSGISVDISNNKVESNSNLGYEISGTASNTNKLLCFKVVYYLTAENGTTACPDQEARVYAYLGAPSFTTISQSEVAAMVPGTIYASPAMLNDVVGYTYASKAETKITGSNEDTDFPDALEKAGFNFSATDIGSPTTLNTNPEQFHPFTLSTGSIEDFTPYYGTYTINYKLKTKDTSVEGSDYGSSTSKNITWVMFDDAGLPKLVSQYEGMELQSFDYSESTALWNAFQTALNHAKALINKPETAGTTPAQLKSVFEAEVEALTTAYENLAKSSTADFTALLKARLVEYDEGDAENKVEPKYKMWDYTPVSYARYSSALSDVKDLYNSSLNKENIISSVKVQEALRFNEVTARILITSPYINETSKPAALKNLKAVQAAYSDTSVYNDTAFTVESMEEMLNAVDAATKTIAKAEADITSVKVSELADGRADILASLNKLVPQVLDVKDLIALIKSTNETYDDNLMYTDEAWERLQNAIKAAYDGPINHPDTVLAMTAQDTAAANALIKSKYEQDIRDAIAYLEANPFVSRFISKTDSVKTYNFGDQLVVGSKVLDVADYLVIPAGVAAKPSTLTQTYFSFSTNVSRYKGYYDDDGVWQWNTYNNSKNVTVTCHADMAAAEKGTTLGQTTKLVTGNIIKVKDNTTDGVLYYTVIVPDNVNCGVNPTKNICNGKVGTGNAAKNYATYIAAIEKYLPNLVHNVGVDSIPDEYALACDLNMDGKVDVTDLLTLKLWKNSTDNDFGIVNLF